MMSDSIPKIQSISSAQSAVLLHCGPWSMQFDIALGALRQVRWNGIEVVRGIYVAVRDRNWNTVAPRLSNLVTTQNAEGFHLTCDVACQQGDIDFAWQGTIVGNAENFTFTMQGEARSDFLKNRIGFCVLHPLDGCAGQPCQIEHTDGTIETSVFPHHIAPHQPFKNLRAIAHEAAPGAWVRVAMTGDVFETEDQRNWTDASYKTYCTPLEQPYPVLIRSGDTVTQRVRLAIVTEEGVEQTASDVLTHIIDRAVVDRAVNDPSGGSATNRPAAGDAFASEGRSAERPRDRGFNPGSSGSSNAAEPGFTPGSPRFGLGMASHGQPLTDTETSWLRALNLSHLRVDLHLDAPDFVNKLAQAAEQARALNTRLEMACFLTDNAETELKSLQTAITRTMPDIARWLIFHQKEKSTSEQWVRLARTFLSGFNAPIVAGTNAYFAELNRERPPVALLDGVCYSLNPQVHADDDTSLMENVQAQAWTVQSAQAFSDGLPVVVSPVTLKPRFNPNATGATTSQAGNELPPEVDARQATLFGAAWTLGSLAALSRSDVASLTFYETTGWRGIMETEAGCALPTLFPSIPGGVFPLYHVLADVAEFTEGTRLRAPETANSKEQIATLVLQKETQRAVLFANLTPEPQTVRWPADIPNARLRLLHTGNQEFAMREPEAFRAEPGELVVAQNDMFIFELPPYAYARLNLNTTFDNLEAHHA